MFDKQTIVLDSSVSGGTFTLSVPGGTTIDIHALSTPTAVRAALEEICHSVRVTGRLRSFVVEFKVPTTLLTADGSKLIGGNKTVTVAGIPETPPPTLAAPAPAAQAAPVKHFAAGSGTVGLTPVSLVSDPAADLMIHADASNSGVICVGNSPTTAADGFILGKGETTPPIRADKVFVVANKSNQGYSYIATETKP